MGMRPNVRSTGEPLVNRDFMSSLVTDFQSVFLRHPLFLIGLLTVSLGVCKGTMAML